MRLRDGMAETCRYLQGWALEEFKESNMIVNGLLLYLMCRAPPTQRGRQAYGFQN